jgi:hypothetical protein
LCCAEKYQPPCHFDVRRNISTLSFLSIIVNYCIVNPCFRQSMC